MMQILKTQKCTGETNKHTNEKDTNIRNKKKWE